MIQMECAQGPICCAVFNQNLRARQCHFPYPSPPVVYQSFMETCTVPVRSALVISTNFSMLYGQSSRYRTYVEGVNSKLSTPKLRLDAKYAHRPTRCADKFTSCFNSNERTPLLLVALSKSTRIPRDCVAGGY